MKLGKNTIKAGAVTCAMLLSGLWFGASVAQDATDTTTPVAAPATPMPNTAPTTSNPPPITPVATVPTVPAVDPAAAAQQKQVQDLVNIAAEYIKQNGKDAAIAEFNKKDGFFTKGNIYVFAVDYTGMSLADVNNPELVGKNQYDLKSQDGKLIVQEGIAKAKAGGGWIQYQWKDPSTQTNACKKSYVMGINGTYLIGSGYYYPLGPDGTCTAN